MTTLDSVYLKTIRFLNNKKMDYIIIGGFAVGLLGEARMTQDIDILIFIEKEGLNNFLKNVQKTGFRFNKKVINNDVELKGAFRLFYNSFHIDFIIGSMPFEKEAFKRSIKLKLYNCQARFPTPEDLILFKLIPGREKDILDAKSVIMRHKGRLDISYMQKWAQIISDDLQDIGVWDRLKSLI